MSCRVASIDLGTNTARLLVADRFADGSFEQMLIEREIVRMGGGFSRESGLSQDAMQRGLGCLKRFSEVLERYDISSLRAVATSAVRDAVNGGAFVEQVYRQTGIMLTVIDGEAEGALTLSGVRAGLDPPCSSILLFDVGGGSTEYTLAGSGDAYFIKSLPLGVVRLTEGKGAPDSITAKIEKELTELCQEIEKNSVFIDPAVTELVATAGTATTLAAINLEMIDYDYRKVNNSILDISDIERIYAVLLPLSLEERMRVPGLEKGREDLIIAGILITLHTMRRFGFNKLRVSDYGLLEGLIVSDL